MLIGLREKKKMPKPKSESQSDRFIETARDLDCDEDEGRFNETLKRIAPKEPKEPVAED